MKLVNYSMKLEQLPAPRKGERWKLASNMERPQQL